jgi:hypothetical protein
VDRYDDDEDNDGDGDAIKRQCKGEGEIILDHGSGMLQVQGGVTSMYVLCVITGYDILNDNKVLLMLLIISKFIILMYGIISDSVAEYIQRADKVRETLCN